MRKNAGFVDPGFVSVSMYAILPVILFVAAGCSSLKDLQIAKASVEYWRATLDGDVTINEGTILGTKIDLHDDLGMDRRDEPLIYRGALQLGPAIIDVKYMNLSYDGVANVRRNIVFNGLTFPVNETVYSNLDFTFATVHGKFGLFGLSYLAIGGIVGIDLLDIDSQLRSNSVGQVSERIDEFFPVVGLTATSNIPFGDDLAFFLEAELSALGGIKYLDIKGLFLDGSARAGVKVASWLSGGVGYRYLKLDAEDEGDDEVDVEVDGISFFVEVSF